MINSTNRLFILARVFQFIGLGTLLFNLLPLVMDPSQFLQRRVLIILLYQCMFTYSMFYAAWKILESLKKPRPLGLIIISILCIGLTWQFAHISSNVSTPHSDQLTHPHFFYNNYMADKIKTLNKVYENGFIKGVPDWSKDGEHAYTLNQPLVDSLAAQYIDNADRFIKEISDFKQKYVVNNFMPVVDGIVIVLSLFTSLCYLLCFINMINLKQGILKLINFTIILSMISLLTYDWQWYFWNTYRIVVETKYFYLVNLSSPDIYQQNLEKISYFSDFYKDVLKNIYLMDFAEPLILLGFVNFYFRQPRIKELYE